MFRMLIKKIYIPDLSVWIYLFSPMEENLSKACRMTAAEMEHLNSFRCSIIHLGQFFKYFFKC